MSFAMRQRALQPLMVFPDLRSEYLIHRTGSWHEGSQDRRRQTNWDSHVNDDYINLNRDSTVSIGPGMNIRVADNDTLATIFILQHMLFRA